MEPLNPQGDKLYRELLMFQNQRKKNMLYAGVLRKYLSKKNFLHDKKIFHYKIMTTFHIQNNFCKKYIMPML